MSKRESLTSMGGSPALGSRKATTASVKRESVISMGGSPLLSRKATTADTKRESLNSIGGSPMLGQGRKANETTAQAAAARAKGWSPFVYVVIYGSN